MNVLVLNAGSSSLKFKLIRMPDEHELLRGIAERVGETRGRARVFCAGPAGRAGCREIAGKESLSRTISASSVTICSSFSFSSC